MTARRVLGAIMLLTGLAIVAFSLIGAIYVGDAITRTFESIERTLDLAADTLDTAQRTFTVTRDTLGDVTASIESAAVTTGSIADTVAESGPLLENVAQVTTQEVPEAIEGVQDALPNLIQVASVIDRTLTTLSAFGIDREIQLPFGATIPLQFDLGIDYNPTQSFDATLRDFSTSLDGLPESLRGLEDDLTTTTENVDVLAADMRTTSETLSTINDRMGDILPLLDEYVALADELDASVIQAKTNLTNQLNVLRYGAIAGMIFLALTQLAPIYLGWELLTGQRGTRQVIVAAEDETTTVTIPPEGATSVVVSETDHPAADTAPPDITLPPMPGGAEDDPHR